MNCSLPHDTTTRCPLRTVGLSAILLLAATMASLTTSGADAATYYVDAQCATCTIAGPGTEAQPYRTLASAVAARKGPGVTILVKPGIYREQITVPASGTAASPYVIQADGTGVVIDGADDYADEALWVQPGPVPVAGGMEAQALDHAWLAPSVTWSPEQVFYQGLRLRRSTQIPALLPVGSFTWVQGEGLYVNVGGDHPGRGDLRVGRRAFGFRVAAKSWVTIEGFEITRADDVGINVYVGSADLRLARNTITKSESYGIKVSGAQRVVIEDNAVSESSYHGIGLTAGATGCIVSRNQAFRNAQLDVRAAKGIHLQGAPNNIIVGNSTYENQDSGVQLNAGSHYNLIYNNRSWNNGDHGFDHLDAIGTSHVHNVAYGNHMDGFSIEGNSPGTQVFNCISADNGLTTGRYNLWVNEASSVGHRSDYNVLWNSNGQPPIKFITTRYLLLSDFRAATGNDMHSLQSNPQLGNPRRGEFVPLAGSPVIDAGSSAVPNWPMVDAGGQMRFDDPETPDHGAGPVTFADIGAVEYVLAVEPAPIELPAPHVTIEDRRPGAQFSLGADRPTMVALSAGFPNPSRGGVAFALDLPGEAEVEWTVYDVLGRAVWSEGRTMAAGRSQLRWDGNVSTGVPAANGIYLLRARVAGTQFSRRVVRF